MTSPAVTFWQVWWQTTAKYDPFKAELAKLVRRCFESLDGLGTMDGGKEVLVTKSIKAPDVFVWMFSQSPELRAWAETVRPSGLSDGDEYTPDHFKGRGEPKTAFRDFTVELIRAGTGCNITNGEKAGKGTHNPTALRLKVRRLSHVTPRRRLSSAPGALVSAVAHSRNAGDLPQAATGGLCGCPRHGRHRGGT